MPALAEAAVAQTGWVQWTTGAGANNRWYLAVYVPGGINWNQARAAAQSLGGDLACITSAAENTFVFQRIADPIFWRVVSNPTRSLGPWLGGFQPAGSAEPLGGWSWVSGEPWGFAPWAPTQPDNVAGLPENQLHFFAFGTSPSDRWNDVQAVTPVPGFVVESASPPVAAYLPLGVGCAPAGGQAPTLLPALTGINLPRLGTSSILRLGNLPSASVLHAVGLGFSNRYASSASGQFALPQSLAALGWPTCNLLVAPDVVLSLPTGPTADLTVLVPNNPNLLGAGFFAQGIALTANGAAAVSAALAGFVGN